VATFKRHIRRKVLDYQHKITTWLVHKYDAVFVEDLNVKGMLEQSHNARNKQDAAWRQFITLLKYKADLYGCYVVQVEPAGTTKECALCGVETAKPTWVREHSCPSCGFETDRDANAAMNVLQRGFSKLGLECPNQRLWRLRSLRTLIQCLQSASSKQEASKLDFEAITHR